MATPAVSVMMPYYDDGQEPGRRLLAQSIAALEAQTLANFEVVLVASGDTSFAQRLAAEHPRIRFFSFEQKAIPGRQRPLRERVEGIIRARNMCLENARAPLVAFADFDDFSMPERLEAQKRFLDENPAVGAVGSSMLLIDEWGHEVGRRAAPETDERIRAHFLQFNPMPTPSVMARKDVLLSAGGFAPGVFAEDYDLWVRVAALSQLRNLRQALVHYRVHPGGGASRYRFQLYWAALGVKWNAMGRLGRWPGPKDVVVNMLQFASLFFPDGLRRTLLERMRGRFVIGAE